SLRALTQPGSPLQTFGRLFKSRHGLAVVAAAEQLVSLVVNVLSDEMNRAVHESKISALWMARFESPGNAIIGHGVLRPADVGPAPTLIIFIDGIVNRNDGGIELRSVGGIPVKPEHMDVFRRQRFTDEQRVAGPVGHITEGNFSARPSKQATSIA